MYIMIPVYRMFNLPVAHPDTGKAFKYIVNQLNWLLLKMSCSMPMEIDFITCIGTKEMFCTQNTALYRMDKINLCISVLYMKLIETVKFLF